MRIGPMRIGIDLGGTKIEGVALSATGLELARELKLDTSCSLELATNSLKGVRRGARMLLLSVE